MCFSVEVHQEIERLMKRFKATSSKQDETLLNDLKARSNDFAFVKEALSLKRKPTSHFFKVPTDDNRVFPGYFTWVMVNENGQNVFKQMRYRVRPSGSKEEIPAKFNVFNARLDALEERQTWKKLFTKQHGIFPFTRFYEWVVFEGQKRLISFAPKDREIMWAPCLWDYWENKERTFSFYSFALITDDPPQEVLEAGHDRCPIFLKEELIPSWLAANKPRQVYYQILKTIEQAYFEHKLAA